jgi:arginine decarboxylase
MAVHGKQLMARTWQLANQAKTKISQIPGLSVLESANTPGFLALDATRLTVSVSGLGVTGFEADEILHHKLGVTSELASLQHLTFIISLGNTQADIDGLVCALETLAEKHPQTTANPYLDVFTRWKAEYCKFIPHPLSFILAFPLAKPSSPKQKRFLWKRL